MVAFIHNDASENDIDYIVTFRLWLRLKQNTFYICLSCTQYWRCCKKQNFVEYNAFAREIVSLKFLRNLFKVKCRTLYGRKTYVRQCFSRYEKLLSSKSNHKFYYIRTRLLLHNSHDGRTTFQGQFKIQK